MKKIFFPLVLLLFSGCASVQTNGQFDPAKAAALVQEDSGFIENGTSAAVQLALYALTKDPDARDKLKSEFSAGCTVGLALIQNNQVDANFVRQSFKIKEAWVSTAIQAVDGLWRGFYDKAEKNGYVSLATQLAIPLLKGVQDAGVSTVPLNVVP